MTTPDMAHASPREIREWEARKREALADAFPGHYSVDALRRVLAEESAEAMAEEAAADELRRVLAEEEAEAVARGEGHPKGKRTGARRDREIAELRRRVKDLETLVDRMAPVLAVLQRRAQNDPTNPMEG